MAEAKSPMICITCKRPFPEDLKAEDSPRYFAQAYLLLRSDDDDAFSNEASVILRFIETITHVTRYATEVEQGHYEDILDLIYQLAEEAKRRLELSRNARAEIWQREHGKDALNFEREKGMTEPSAPPIQSDPPF